MRYSVRRDDGAYVYFDAPGDRFYGQKYDAPTGKPTSGMYPPQAWDITVPNGAKRAGTGPLPEGVIAVLKGKALAGLELPKAGGVAAGGFIAGWLIGRWLK